jgi:hypothetical protein
MRRTRRLLISKKKANKKYKRKTQKMSIKKLPNQMNCSPIVKNSRVSSETCFTPEILMSIKEAFNKKTPQDPINETEPTKIWWALKNRLDCQKEDCWLDSLFDFTMKEQIKQFIFAPKIPPEWKSNPDEWLSNFDIEDVMKQYQISHPEFKFIGPTTIDFDTRPPEMGGKCVLEDLCNFNLDRFIRAKKTKIGIVFNLDRRNQPGSHWVSTFIDIENKFVFFFDSANNEIPEEIWQKNPNGSKKKPFINRVLEQGLQLPKPINFEFYNNLGHKHQKSNTECGMYSLFFIITMLTGEIQGSDKVLSIKERKDLFLQKTIPDKYVFDLRKIYYND